VRASGSPYLPEEIQIRRWQRSRRVVVQDYLRQEEAEDEAAKEAAAGFRSRVSPRQGSAGATSRVPLREFGCVANLIFLCEEDRNQAVTAEPYYILAAMLRRQVDLFKLEGSFNPQAGWRPGAPRFTFEFTFLSQICRISDDFVLV
jgi:hypothetical protein